MKIAFLGDSITDMGRNREVDGGVGIGTGYVFYIAGDIKREQPSVQILIVV